MLGHCLRRWPNIDPTAGQCLVFAPVFWLIDQMADHVACQHYLCARASPFDLPITDAFRRFRPESADYSTAVQSRKAVSSHFTSEQILPFSLAEHSTFIYPAVNINVLYSSQLRVNTQNWLP